MCAEPALPGWSCLGSSSSEEKPAEGREMPQEFTDKAEEMQQTIFPSFPDTICSSEQQSVAAQLNHNTPDSLDAAWDPPAAAPCGSNPSPQHSWDSTWAVAHASTGVSPDELSLLLFSSQDIVLKMSLALPTSTTVG